MKKTHISPLFVGLIMIVLGVILVLYSGQAMATILRITAVGFLVAGAVGVAGYFLGKDDEKKSILKLFVYAIEAMAGLIVLINPKFILDIYPIAMGIIIAVDGLGNLFQALSMKKQEGKPWKAMLLLSVITILLGIMIICNPFSMLNVLTIVIGAVLVYDGLTKVIAAVNSKKINSCK